MTSFVASAFRARPRASAALSIAALALVVMAARCLPPVPGRRLLSIQTCRIAAPRPAGAPLSGFLSHEQVGEALRQIERTSHGRVAVEAVGHTNLGREIWAARVATAIR